MSDSQWVVSKYAPATGDKFKVVLVRDGEWVVDIGGHSRLGVFPKSEYILTTPLERWETVSHCYWKLSRARDQAWLHCGILSHEAETQIGPLALPVLSSIYRFDIQEGRLVLQRRVTG